jgi:hypothetical protein
VVKKLLLLLALAACDNGFRPETRVVDLRILGERSTPADLAPGETARLDALLVDPSMSTPPTMLWIGCDPDPYNQNRSPCADSNVLSDPAALTGTSGTLPPGVNIIGFNDQASYAVSANLFDVLAATDPIRQTGTIGLVLGFAVAETVSPAATPDELKAVFARAQDKTIKSVISLFRIHISESSERNHNPVPVALVVDGVTWPANAAVGVFPGSVHTLDVTATPDSFEPYTQVTPAGPVAQTEKVQVAWYSTAGLLSQTDTQLDSTVKPDFTAPSADDVKNPLPDKPAITLWTTLRDSRGGQSWKQWKAWLCDPALPTPLLSTIDWPRAAADPVVLHGEHLENVLDYVVDGVALEHGAFSPTAGTWEGTLPAGTSVGSVRGFPTSKNCVLTP